MGIAFARLTKSFQADGDPRERGPRPLNSHRYPLEMLKFFAKHKTTILAILMAVLLFIGLPLLAWYAVSSVLSWITSQQSEVAPAIIAAAATILAGIGAVIFSQQRTKTREIAETHRPKKVELYTTFVKKVMEVMQKSKEEGSDDSLIEHAGLQECFEEFTTDLILWGSPSVIRAYHRFRELSTSGTADTNIVVVMDDVMRTMRKDLGHSDWTLQRGEVIKLFLKDPEELDKVL